MRTQASNLGAHVKVHGTYDDNLRSPAVFNLSHPIVYVRLLELFNCLAMDLKVDRWTKLRVFWRQVLVHALDLAVVRLEDWVLE